MPIVAGDIVWRYSGGASNTSAAASLGGVMSTVAGGVIDDNVLNDLFDDVSGTESTAGDTEYRCFFVENTHGTLTAQTAVIWIQSQSSSADTAIEIGLDGNALSATTSTSTSANENTAPSPAVTFTTAANEGAALSIGNMAPGEQKAIWVKRIVTAGAAAANDTFTLRFKCETAA
jgi:hypothetical protein